MPFVVSEGALRPLERAQQPVGYTLQISDDYSADYAEIWRTQPAVRTVVTFLARNIASLGIHVFERLSDTDRRRLTDHPMASLLGRPNPWTTRYRFVNALVHDLGIYDAHASLKVRAGDALGLVRVPPPKITPLGENWMRADEYRVTGTRGTKDMPAEQVFYVHGYHPEDDRVGCAPMESLRRILAEEWAAGQMREQVLRNGARFSGYIKRPTPAAGGTKDWSPAAKTKFLREWQAQYAGNGPAAGGTPVLEDGMEFVAAAQTAEQLEYVAARKLTREEVAAAYFIPPPMVGILDHATFGNIEEQHKMLYQDTLGPWLQMLAEEIALQLLPDVDTNPAVYVEFNLEAKLRGSFEEQAARLQTSVGAPYMTRNEARALANLPSIDGGDELVVPLNVLVGGQASPRDGVTGGGGGGTLPELEAGEEPKAAPRRSARTKQRPPSTYTTKAAEVLAAFFRRQSSAVRSRLGGKADVDEDWWDAERWDRELTADLYRLNVAVSTNAAHATLASVGVDPDEYDVDRTLAFLLAVAGRVASQINTTTKAQLDAALASDDPAAAVAHVFDIATDSRSAASATTLVTTVAGFATVEAGKQVAGDKATKTWVVTSSNPRASHAAMDGETVPIDQPFSNGAMWPADSALDVDEVAGCQCDVVLTFA